jgi:endogenous inhibitor of DNA gyrase (YacG/DUF329 family)
MIETRCPICSRRVAVSRIQDLPTFPFCSERCRLIDLGRWIDGVYVIPGPPAGGSETGAIPGSEGTHSEDDSDPSDGV